MTEYLDVDEFENIEKYSKETVFTKLWKQIGNLNTNEQYVIGNYYGLRNDEMTEEEIENELEISKQRVSQIRKNAIKKLRLIRKTS